MGNSEEALSMKREDGNRGGEDQAGNKKTEKLIQGRVWVEGEFGCPIVSSVK
jgi:hypothetical protein